MGNLLFETVVHETDLSNEAVSEELARLLARYDKSPDTMSINDLRKIMLAMLDEVFFDMQMREEDSADIHVS